MKPFIFNDHVFTDENDILKFLHEQQTKLEISENMKQNFFERLNNIRKYVTYINRGDMESDIKIDLKALTGGRVNARAKYIIESDNFFKKENSV